MPTANKEYQWTEVPEGILVYDVEVATQLNKGELAPRGQPDIEISAVDYEKAVALFNLRKTDNKYPRLEHNHGGPQIGIAPDVWYGAGTPWFYNDWLITNPEAIAKLKRGELPARSIDYWADTHFLYAVALTDSKGHYDEEMPDLILAKEPIPLKAKYFGHPRISQLPSDEQPAELCSGPRYRIACKSVTLQENYMDAASAAKLQALEDGMKAMQGQLTALMAKMGEKPGENAELAAAKAAAEKAKIELEVSTKAIELVGKGCPVKLETIKADALKLTTGEGREQYFARLETSCAKADDAAKPAAGKDTTVQTEIPNDAKAVALMAREKIDGYKRDMKLNGAAAVKRLAAQEPKLYESWLSTANGGRKIERTSNGRVVAV